MDDTSLEVVNAREMYPGQPFTSDGDDGSIPFALLSGENPLFKGHSSDNVIVITNYRFYHSENPCINIPLGLIDYVECREILYIWIHCKDARTYRCVFENADETKKWLERIQMNIKLPEKIDHSFAFRFLSWTREDQKDVIMSQSLNQLEELLEPKDQPPENFLKEAQRMGFNFKHVWKISRINENYKFCPSYPRYIIFPAIMDDPAIQDTANFRYSRRIPAVVWRYPRNGCVIARCSQPKLGLLYWRNSNDENLIAAILSACSEDKGDDSKEEIREPVLKNEDDADMSIYCSEDSAKKSQKRLLIMDARSFFHAAGNRTKGGGYECTSYYLNCDIHYMGLANIHTIRSSFNALRTLASADDQIWLSTLESTKWLHHISGLLRSALVAVDAIDIDEKPVLVHCSDGWDRTPQIVALAEIMLDPYYRTKKGFQVLVEREWLEFGHKFADRCGNPGGTDDRNERCPVFLQWLDCIYQLLNQFPCHFEFNEQYLARLVLHSYSSLFGTFLCNTEEDRKTHSVPLRTYSVWPVLNDKSQFHNYLYNKSTEVLRPSYQIRCLKFWSELYVPNSSIGLVKQTLPPPVEEVPLVESIPEKTNLVKTKSCDDIHSTEHLEMLHRHNSDPNLVENSFAETVTCSQLQNCNEGTNNLLTVETPLCDDKANSTISERTENQISEAIVNSNLILREPTIDGSTDTLVSESGAVVQEQNEIKSSSEELCDTRLVSKPSSSISTDTSDLPILLEDLLLSMTQNAGYIDSAISNIPDWCQNVMDTHVFKRNGHSNSFSCSYTTPNHSRTPSSGFPATPCDDSNDLPNLKKESSCQVMEFDGLDIMSNCVQERIRKLLLHYKDKVGNLNSQLAAVRLEFLQHICRHYQGKDRCRLEEDALSLADSASSGDHQVESEEGSESSWDLICSLDHGTTGLGM